GAHGAPAERDDSAVGVADREDHAVAEAVEGAPALLVEAEGAGLDALFHAVAGPGQVALQAAPGGVRVAHAEPLDGCLRDAAPGDVGTGLGAGLADQGAPVVEGRRVHDGEPAVALLAGSRVGAGGTPHS